MDFLHIQKCYGILKPPFTIVNKVGVRPIKYICYDIKPVRKEEGKFYWKIPFGDDEATREK